ncbi:UNVERIFIED_CONTAM: Heat shock protein 17 [Sesamum angustifolium]|uniref:Heat shock protein 17 n=1 Tax=Sesamum angustifolium TaxID=2727405 RepID=A0AAW2J570_9LAMI
MATTNSLRALLLLSLFLLNTFQSESAVASIDLGSEWLKVAVVNLKPGQPPISIAINEMSKRKTPSLISFHADSRLIGEESSNLLARYPQQGVFPSSLPPRETLQFYARFPQQALFESRDCSGG